MQMPNFVHYDYNQSTTIVINYLDQLHSGTFEHALHHLVENKLDLSSFYLRYQNDKTGRPAYDPAFRAQHLLHPVQIAPNPPFPIRSLSVTVLISALLDAVSA